MILSDLEFIFILLLIYGQFEVCNILANRMFLCF